MTVRFDIDPVSKPRMTKSDRWKTRPETSKYWTFKDDINAAALAAKFQLPDTYAVVFRIPMPASWSKKKRLEMNGKPHQQTPDNDNLIKALQDALRPQDSGIWSCWVEKRWAEAGSIEIHTDGEIYRFLKGLMARRSPESL